MLALKPFRDKAAGVRRPPQLEPSGRVRHCPVQGRQPACRVVLSRSRYRQQHGWRAQLADPAGSTPRSSRLGNGWATWVDAVRLPASGYPPRELSHFPDPGVAPGRRGTPPRSSCAKAVHYESEYALIVQFTPPLRRKSKLVDIIYDDDPAEGSSPADRILEQFKKALADLEDAMGDAVQLRRMESFTVADRYGRDHLRDRSGELPAFRADRRGSCR